MAASPSSGPPRRQWWLPFVWHMANSLQCIVLRGAGLECHVSRLGATIVKFFAPDRHGQLADVTLGYDTAEEYARCSTYFGSVVGRCANRVAKGRFSVDGKPCQLVCNNGENALHGGPGGFHTRSWSVDHLLGADGRPLAAAPADGSDAQAAAGVQLSLVSPDGEEGYPGQLHARVTYLLHSASMDATPECPGGTHPALKTAFEATVEGSATVVNLAQHAYWNLGGHDAGDATASHTMRLHAARYTPVDGSLIPTGQLAPATPPFDFARGKPLCDGLSDVPGGRGFDHNFVLDGPHAMRGAATPPADAPSFAAEAYHQASGRCMRLFTDAPGVQLYVGGFLDQERGKGGAVYQRHGGFCLETQIFPDAINQPGFPSPILRPGERYVHTMLTQFLTK